MESSASGSGLGNYPGSKEGSGANWGNIQGAGTANNGLSDSGFGDSGISQQVSGQGGAAVPKADGLVRAKCPACGATFSAPWRTCLHCGGSTEVYDAPKSAQGIAPAANAGPPSASSSGISRTAQTKPPSFSESSQPSPNPDNWNNLYKPSPSASEASQPPSTVAQAPVPESRAPVLQKGKSWSESSLRDFLGTDEEEASFEGETLATPGPQEEFAQPDDEVVEYDESDSFEPDPPSQSMSKSIGSGTTLPPLERPRDASKNKRKLLRVAGGLLAVVVVIAGGIAALQFLPALKASAGGSPVEAHANGQPKYSGTFNKEGKEVGHWIYWSEDGQRKDEGEFHNGTKMGMWTKWDDNGQISEHGAYRDGQPDGPWTYRDEAGLLKEQGTFQAGVRQGAWTEWHPTGFKKAEGTYDKNKKTGTWKYWDNEGNLLEAPPETSPPSTTPATPATSNSTPPKSDSAPAAP